MLRSFDCLNSQVSQRSLVGLEVVFQSFSHTFLCLADASAIEARPVLVSGAELVLGRVVYGGSSCCESVGEALALAYCEALAPTCFSS